MSGILTTPTIELKINNSSVATQNILQCNLHLGCTREVSTFVAVIDNSNPDYNSGDYSPGGDKEFTKGDSVTIKIKRGTISGSTNYLFTGTLETLEYIDEAEEYQYRNVVVLSGRCKGSLLFNRKYDGDLIADVDLHSYQQYKRTSGEAESLVAYLIDNYTTDASSNPLSHIRETSVATGNANSGQKVVNVTDGSIFTAGDLVKIYDDAPAWEYNKIDSIDTNELTMISNLVNSYTTAANLTVGLDLIRDTDTTYTKMEFTHETIFDIIKWIADTADTSGTIGYDSRVEYDGKYAFLPRGLVTESYTLSAQVQTERYLDDSTRIKNKITVYGKADKPFPYIQATDDSNDYSDHWTETYSSRIAQLVYNASSGENKISVPYNKLSYFPDSSNILLTDYNVVYEKAQVVTSHNDSELGTSDASSGQKIVDVVDGSTFSAGDFVRIYDDSNSEYNKIASINVNELTMEDNLTNAYTTAANLTVAQNFYELQGNLTNSFTTTYNTIACLGDSSELKGWGYIPTVGDWDDISSGGLTSVQKIQGSYSSIFQHTTGGYNLNGHFFMEDSLNVNLYKELRGALYFDTTIPKSVTITFYSGNITSDELATARLSTSFVADEWLQFSLPIGEDNESNWSVGSLFDWSDVYLILIAVYYPTSTTHFFYLDKFHFYGKRWGGGTDNSAIDGFAEDTTSQTTYGIREHVVVNDLILSDADCEAKAQSLLAYYTNPRVTIIPDSKTLDWVDYPIIPGNKVAVNLTPLGLSDDYRIDSCDISLNAIDHELTTSFEMDDTPPRTADYLQGIVDRLKTVEKSVQNISGSTTVGSVTASGSGGTIDHDSLTNVTTSQHHVKYTDAEAIAAVEGEATLDLDGSVTIAIGQTLSADTINEMGTGTGVTVDGLLIKDGMLLGTVTIPSVTDTLMTLGQTQTVSGAITFSHATTPIATDIIIERTGATGVTIDGLTIKDGGIGETLVVTGNITSEASDTRNLGSTSLEFANLYIGDAGKIYLGLGQDTSINRSASNTLTITASSGVVTSAGLTITGTLSVDTISERTGATGITIDGLLIKDNAIGSTSAEIELIYLDDSGIIYFGSAQDTNLYRPNANELKTDDVFICALNIIAGSAITGSYDGGLFSNSGSLEMWRGTDGVPFIDLKTDYATDYDVRIQKTAVHDLNIVVGGSASLVLGLTIAAAGQLQLPVTGTTGGLLIGGDAGIYRSAANIISLFGGDSFSATSFIGSTTIYLDDSSVAPTHIIIKGASNNNKQLLIGFNTTNDYGSLQAIEQGAALRPLVLNPYGGDVSLSINTVLFGTVGSEDTNLYRSVANILKTDDQFQAADGVVNFTKAGAISDADFTVDTTGLIGIDTTNNRLYFRTGAATWHYIDATV